MAASEVTLWTDDVDRRRYQIDIVYPGTWIITLDLLIGWEEFCERHCEDSRGQQRDDSEGRDDADRVGTAMPIESGPLPPTMTKPIPTAARLALTLPAMTVQASSVNDVSRPGREGLASPRRLWTGIASVVHRCGREWLCRGISGWRGISGAVRIPEENDPEESEHRPRVQRNQSAITGRKSEPQNRSGSGHSESEQPRDEPLRPVNRRLLSVR